MWDRLCGVKADRSGTYGGDRCEGTRRQGAHITPSNYRVAKNPSITTRPVGLTISLRTAPTFKSLAISPVRDYFRPQIPHGPIISDNTVRLAGLESERGYSFCLDSLVWSSHPSSLPLSLSLSLLLLLQKFRVRPNCIPTHCQLAVSPRSRSPSNNSNLCTKRLCLSNSTLKVSS